MYSVFWFVIGLLMLMAAINNARMDNSNGGLAGSLIFGALGLYAARYGYHGNRC